MASTQVAIYGFGCVGQGIVTILHDDPDFTGLLHIWRRDPTKKLAFCKEENIQTKCRFYGPETDPLELVNDSKIPVIIEVMGGNSGLPFAIVSAAILAGKTIITANKSLLATRTREIENLLDQNGKARLFFEAAVCGGMPIIHTLNRFHKSVNDPVSGFYGIVNGSTNYLLSTLSEDATIQPKTLIEKMQQMGFLESDPSLDLKGFDAFYKLSLLIRMIFNCYADHNIIMQGVDQIATSDFDYARSIDCEIKLVAGAESKQGGGIEAFVLPSLVPKSSTIANVHGSSNFMSIKSAYMGELKMIAPGAGSLPTAQSVVSDLMYALHVTENPTDNRKAKDCENSQLLETCSARSNLRQSFVLRCECDSMQQLQLIEAICDVKGRVQFGEFCYVVCDTSLSAAAVDRLRSSSNGNIVIYQRLVV